MQRRIEGALRNLDNIARYLLQTQGDRVPVHGAKRDNFQDQPDQDSSWVPPTLDKFVREASVSAW